jgi:hypothetical protein
MALVGKFQQTVPIPHEPGKTITFRQLNWVQLEEAERVRSASVLRNLREMGPEIMREMQGVQREAVEAAPTVAQDPLATYDRATLLKYGIVGWSYPEPVSAATIADLDTQTADWAARQIVDMHKTPSVEDQTVAFLLSNGSSTEKTSTPPPSGSSG